ncbi:hypothetical protein [Neobacillus jeddahensis]|uniref:hypothetical protein n=1 Tax=Neobacillus jeddahensis TaxID=1461580 RepID=UPI00058F4F9F|nr:hypothetical protein [Neobacillus jeddahensis]
MTIGDIKNFIYIPSSGFIEVVKDGPIEMGVHPLDYPFKPKEEKVLSDQAILRRLRRQYPGCKIVQNDGMWEVIFEEDE